MIRPQYSRLAGARVWTVAISVAVVAAGLKAGAVPATPITTDSPSPSAPASSPPCAFASMVALPSGTLPGPLGPRLRTVGPGEPARWNGPDRTVSSLGQDPARNKARVSERHNRG